jgi:hypothetical protein
MSEAAMRLLEQIRALPIEEQDWLAEELNTTPSPQPKDLAFVAELLRRSDEAHTHPEKLVPWENLQQELARIRAERGQAQP